MANSISHQQTLPIFDYSDVVDDFANGDSEARGAVFTRREVVVFVLDLAGYTTDRPLHRRRLLEPAFGDGDFLLPAVERLLTTYAGQIPYRSRKVADLGDAIRAVELHHDSIERTRARLLDLLRSQEISDSDAHRLLDSWIIAGDFLLADLPGTFTHAVGNPPYVRQELIPDVLLAEYRSRYRTTYDRADLYIPFIERCLSSLEPNGTLGFICSDRWMKNKYGVRLREMVARQYHLTHMSTWSTRPLSMPR